ncbi:MAG: hypothetical protein FWG13_03160 [Leptospirales bacterium]|nr:hypothetical protein [Leptospirales bacterium]
MNNRELILSIRDSIKSILDGTMNADEAEDTYLKLEKTCIDIENASHSSDASHMGRIIYSHNIDNFAKLTAVIKKTGSISELFRYSGNIKFVSAIKEIIAAEENVITGTSFCEFGPYKINGTPCKFFFNYAKIDAAEYITASVVSPQYADSQKFNEMTGMLRRHISAEINFDSIDYYKSAREYAAAFADQGEKTAASVFIIDGLDERFNLNEIIDASRKIQDKLKATYGDKAAVIVISYNVYLVLRHNTNSNAKSVSIDYDNSSLKYAKHDFILSQAGDLDNVWKIIDLSLCSE